MTFRDATGKVLNEGDLVCFPTAWGNAQVVPIAKMESGLGAQGTDAAQPKVYLQLVVVLPAAPNGVVGGIIKVADKPVTM